MVEQVPIPHTGYLMASKTPDEEFGFGHKGSYFADYERKIGFGFKGTQGQHCSKS
jgi:hypothetical protein